MSPLDAIDAALSDIDKARKRVAKCSRQVRDSDTLDYLRSVAYAWFRTYKPSLEGALAASSLAPVDESLRHVIDATSKSSTKTTYEDNFKQAKSSIGALRAEYLTTPTSPATRHDPAPDFSPLASDPVMQAILVRRWDECQRCIQAQADLAATIMMGGFLEALFVAKANQMSDKSPLFKAKATPIDPRTKKPLPLSEWTLRPYIDVGHELGWITRSGRDVAAVLRDYRNYVHPEKERSHGVSLNPHDSTMFWNVTKNLTSQLLRP